MDTIYPVHEENPLGDPLSFVVLQMVKKVNAYLAADDVFSFRSVLWQACSSSPYLEDHLTAMDEVVRHYLPQSFAQWFCDWIHGAYK